MERVPEHHSFNSCLTARKSTHLKKKKQDELYTSLKHSAWKREWPISAGDEPSIAFLSLKVISPLPTLAWFRCHLDCTSARLGQFFLGHSLRIFRFMPSGAFGKWKRCCCCSMQSRSIQKLYVYIANVGISFCAGRVAWTSLHSRSFWLFDHTKSKVGWTFKCSLGINSPNVVRWN